ncbi:hypothetical protein CKM354_000146700 [Cercospora kikuchii]|uniref:Uncharacterized protein n=1 Tax=Cercospora kikuchii TaxID=84275 RepID=A0A9P3FCZ9_9PEZI|nr:uncharacterized protein CKM354_000146700 [Cercospora kikuchii]GIZ38040.1 hypothetical protein CKM354_000146700 [Cercospora kikuchii]
MLQPVTVTGAASGPRKLQKDHNPRHSYRKSFRYASPRCSSLLHGSRNDSQSPLCFDGTGGPGLYSNRSSFSTNGSPIGAHPSTTRSLRVHTKGALLTSGFPYHPGLFDLKIHRIMWEKFTSQIVDSMKLSPAERAKVWAVSTAAAVATPDNYLVARNKSQHILEDKMKEGLISTAPASLASIIREWNEGYFAERGLLARLELTDAQPPAQRGGLIPQEVYLRRVQAEREFSIVVARQWEPEDVPLEVLRSSSPASCSSLKHSDHGTPVESACSTYSTAFKPLPEFPLGSDPLLDVAAELSHLTCYPSPEPPQASQFAELEGDVELEPHVQEIPLPSQSGSDERSGLGVCNIDIQYAQKLDTQELALAEVLTKLNATTSHERQHTDKATMNGCFHDNRTAKSGFIPAGHEQLSRDSSVIDCSPDAAVAGEKYHDLWKTHPAHRSLVDNNAGTNRSSIEVMVVEDTGEQAFAHGHRQEATSWSNDWPLDLDGYSGEIGCKHYDQPSWDVWHSKPNWPLEEPIPPSLLPHNAPASCTPVVTESRSIHSRDESKSSDQPPHGHASRITGDAPGLTSGTSRKDRPSKIPQRTRRKVSVLPALEVQHAKPETFAKPMRSPSASFFLPLDMKAISTSLDFDTGLRAKDLAIML